MYTRELKGAYPVAIDGYGSVETGVTFKQYDVNTSILNLDLTFENKPADISGKNIFISLKTSKKLLTSPLGGTSYFEKKNTSKGILLKGEKVSNSSIRFILSPSVLEETGSVVGEIIFVDIATQQRTTSQQFKFNIEASLTPNLVSKIHYVNVTDIAENIITDLENYELIAPTLEANSTAVKLNFTGEEINQILTKSKNLNIENYHTKAEVNQLLSKKVSSTDFLDSVISINKSLDKKLIKLMFILKKKQTMK